MRCGPQLCRRPWRLIWLRRSIPTAPGQEGTGLAPHAHLAGIQTQLQPPPCISPAQELRETRAQLSEHCASLRGGGALGEGRARGGGRGGKGPGLAAPLQVSTRAVVQPGGEREPRKTSRAHKQSHVASGPGGRAKNRRLFRQQRAAAGGGDKYCGRKRRAALPEPAAPETLPASAAPQGAARRSAAPFASSRPPPPSRAPHPEHPPRVARPRGRQAGPVSQSAPSALGAMPFLGQDWRSPGQSWVKTADGWKRFLDEKSGSFVSDLSSYCNKEVYNKENLFNSLNYDVAAKKRKKDMLNSKTKTQYFHQEKWIYVHKGSTKERHGYCTLGEAFNRLDFSTAILDSRRFNYVVRLLELIAKSQLTSLSGIAQKNFMNILEKVVLKVLEDQQNIRLIRELLQTLYTSLCTLVQRVGKSVLVGNINMWVYRMETILHWQQQLNNIQITRPAFKGLTFTDLPLCLQLNIMQRLSDGRDLVSLGQAAPDLHVLSEDRLLWKKLCQYHFSERQIRKRLILSDKGQLDWKRMYFKLVRCYPRKEQYGDTLQLCKHCHILSWKGTDHPCTANNPESCSVSLSPQDFINLFKF
uniref:F-box only protein 32 n=2 Tax=Callithrix jacchus TaxID=9483 RepID=A0A2R8MIH7_CALJA|nr:F-box only protein 32 [Callithrix jacchus]